MKLLQPDNVCGRALSAGPRCVKTGKLWSAAPRITAPTATEATTFSCAIRCEQTSWMKIAVTGGAARPAGPSSAICSSTATRCSTSTVSRRRSRTRPDTPAPFLARRPHRLRPGARGAQGGDGCPASRPSSTWRRSRRRCTPRPTRGLPHQRHQHARGLRRRARLGLQRVVWASSETTLGLPFDTPPDYAPVDEQHDCAPSPATRSRRSSARRWRASSAAGAASRSSACASRTSWSRADYAAVPGFWDDPHAAQVEPVGLRRREPCRRERRAARSRPTSTAPTRSSSPPPTP